MWVFHYNIANSHRFNIILPRVEIGSGVIRHSITGHPDDPVARENEADPDPEAVVPHVGQGVHLPAEDDAPPGGHLGGEEDADGRGGVHVDLLRQGKDLGL